MTTPTPVWRPYGERGVVLELGDVIDATLHDAVLRADAAVRRAMASGSLPSVEEVVPSYRSLLVRLHPDAELATTRAQLSSVVNPTLTDHAPLSPTLHEVAVHVGPSDADDLDEVATQLSLSRDDVVGLLSSVDLRVYLHGFAPGFAYLGGVPPALHLPRRATPRRPVRPGSVLLAAGQVALCPSSMPTGWWVVGRTDHVLFDPGAPPHVPFQPGDTVRLRAIAPGAS